MFGWMMGFVTTVRCWDSCFANVGFVLVLALWCSSAVVLKREVEIRNAVGPGFGQGESALVAHLMMQIALVQQCMFAISQSRMESVLHRWLPGLVLFQH